jgi:Spy/CpxP family protein refolding chaperone
MKPTKRFLLATQSARHPGGTTRSIPLKSYGLATALALTLSAAHVQAQNNPPTETTPGAQSQAAQPNAMPNPSMQHSMPGHSMRGPQTGSGHGAHGQHGGMHAQGHGSNSQHGGMHAQGHGHRMSEGSAGGFGRMLQGLGLDEAQRDRIFSIRHAAAPAMREKGKALRAARQELASLALATEYDSARAKAAAEQLARATADMAELRARTHHEVFRVLTPEQQKQLQDRRARMHAQGASHGHREGAHRS